MQNPHGYISLSSTSLPPFSSHTTNPSQEPKQRAPDTINTDEIIDSTGKSNLKVAQLNCFNQQAVMENLLAEDQIDILIIQEPWVNPHTLKLETHPAWHDFMAYDYTAHTYNEKTRTGIYVSKRIPSWNIAMLPSGSPYITAVEITNLEAGLPSLRILSVYNPPTHNTGLPVLETWLRSHNNRKTPTLIGMDANLHHTLWNPVMYRHTHPKAKELIKMQGCSGFKIVSQKHVPTFYPRARGKPTTIDLT